MLHKGERKTDSPSGEDQRSSAWRSRLATHMPWIWSRLVVVAGTLFAMLMVALCAVSLYQSRVDSYERTEQTLRDVVLIADRDIERNFELYSLSLQAVVDEFGQPEVMSLPPNLQRQLLFDRAATAQYLGAMLVLDEQGNITIDSDHDIPRVGNFADRAYFQVHRERPDVGLYVSEPYSSRLRGGSMSLALSRRLNKPDGSFAGVVILTIQLRYFHDLFAGLSLGRSSALALMRSDGIVIMRQPLVPGVVGKSFAQGNVYRKIASLGAAHGTFLEITSVDGVSRLYAYRRIGKLPLIISAGAAEKDFYAAWKRRATVIGMVIIASGIAFIALSLLLAGQLRRRMVAEAELKLLARTDGLTGLNNRRTLGEILDKEWRRAQRTHNVFSLLFVDIDYFKDYNDAYGHQAGDTTLAAVAHCITGNIRQMTDSAARYGGEEFVIVLPDTNERGARAVADKILTAISDLAITHPKSRFGRVTASIGAASWDPSRHPNVSAVIKAADEALYQAKASGRNVTATVPTTPPPTSPA